jgi:hypothetical protein
MRWIALQFDTVWDSLYVQCDGNTQEMLDRRYVGLLEKGNLSERPISAPLRDGIFELRANAARMLFFFGPKRLEITFVNCFFKKQREVPPEEIDLAIKRRGQILARMVTPNALAN